MPLWWGKKNGRSRDRDEGVKKKGGSDGYKRGEAEPPSRNSPRGSGEFMTVAASTTATGMSSGRGSAGFSGFESDGLLAERRGHPLPLPVNTVVPVMDLGAGGESGSASVSSLVSSGSSDDQFGADCVPFGLNRGYGDRKCSSRAISPALGSRSSTAATSPLHPRLSAGSGNRQEDGASQCHPLPLPPNSPTSPPTLPNKRTRVADENNPQSLSQWKKGKLLGRGSFGHVYVGFNSDSGQMCAIKEVKVVQDDRASKECLKQLNQEINLLSKLSHPNIVQYYGSEMNEETLSVYLEYVSGGSIYKLLQEYGAFKEPVIQNYARQIVYGLVYLHGRNTLHRDIKGANILVDPNGDVKLADFGMAKHITSASSMLSFKGSPYWMAPEVVMNASSCNFAIDIWSLGCTILEMATGKPPWSQYEGVAAIFKIGNSKEMPEVPNHLSSDAKSFINLSLQRDPSRRPTALQLLGHPFIYEQATTREANVRITRDAFFSNNDGSRNPSSAQQFESNRKSIGSYDVDYGTYSAGRVQRGSRSPRENVRTIMSLPVSPSASPLRQRGSTYQNSFTPPHSSSSVARQNYSSANNILPYPPRPSPAFALDPWREVTPSFQPQSPEPEDPFSLLNHEIPPFHCPPSHPAELVRASLIH